MRYTGDQWPWINAKIIIKYSLPFISVLVNNTIQNQVYCVVMVTTT
jgi:hypothetical protein